MRFWDTSAVVPLVVDEPTSNACLKLLRADRALTVWSLTRTEVVSALQRKHREGSLDVEATERATRKLEQLTSAWVELSGIIEVRGHAERFLREHALRAADALQLAAAFVAVDGSPRNREFVVFDGNLAAAARATGFTVTLPS